MAHTEEQVAALLRGAYDLHVHAAPDQGPRALDDFELARQMDAVGMAGGITKSHYDPTGGRAAIANRYAGTKAKLYGAVALNRPAGGINPHAVDAALKLGAKMVWLPTRDVRFGLKAVGEDGKLLPEVYEVFEVVKQYGAWLATGHLTPAQSELVITEGLRHGVNMILTHPDAKSTNVPLASQIALAGAGAMVEKAWGNVQNGYLTAAEMAESIRAIGPEHVFLVTDFGQTDSPMPVQGMHDFIAALLDNGFSEAEIITMTHSNPARIVGAAE